MVPLSHAQGELNEAGTVSDTIYITTTDSVPTPEEWPEVMQNGIYAVTVKTPDDEMPASYRYRTEGWPMAEAVLGEPPKDNDNNNNTVHTYSWNSHDAVLTIAKAYHNMKTSSSPTAGGSTGTELRDYIEEIGNAEHSSG